MHNNNITEIIREKELKLLTNEVRGNAEAIAELLDESFFEFTSSGKEYYYSPGDKFNLFEDTEFQISEFQVKTLAPTLMLALYKFTVKTRDKEDKLTLRSTIWEYKHKTWKAVFHQGTIIE